MRWVEISTHRICELADRKDVIRTRLANESLARFPHLSAGKPASVDSR